MTYVLMTLLGGLVGSGGIEGAERPIRFVADLLSSIPRFDGVPHNPLQLVHTTQKLASPANPLFLTVHSRHSSRGCRIHTPNGNRR